MRTRFIDTKANKVTRFASLTEYTSTPTVPLGITTIMDNGIPIDVLNSDIGSDTTIVFFHGAIEKTHTLPVLSGQGISTNVAANRIFVSDPTLGLSDELLLGWYAGNRHQNLQSILERIIRKIWESHNSRRIAFFGGSGGGFASLYFASRFPESLAIAFNPQTDIGQYNDHAVIAYARNAFNLNITKASEIDRTPKSIITNLVEIYANSLNCDIAYIQNLNDETHIQRHMNPFIESLNNKNRIAVLADKWRAGHTPPPKEILTNILEHIAGGQDWQTSLREAGFRITKDSTRPSEPA